MSALGLDLPDEDFQALAALVYQKAGINLHEGKRQLVRARLAKRIREGGFGDFRGYYQHVIQDQSGDELVTLLDAISTNLTSFFRESNHFKFMRDVLLPGHDADRRDKGKRELRVWSAGCSTGEEPYSIVMTVLKHDRHRAADNFKVLATDLSTRALSVASRGIYPEDRTVDLPRSMLQRFFQKGRGENAGHYRIREEVRRLVAFRRLNLMDPFPMRKPFDVIFFRNVMIYFNKATQAVLAAKMRAALADGGYLFIGHSESLTGFSHQFRYIQPTIYRK